MKGGEMKGNEARVVLQARVNKHPLNPPTTTIAGSLCGINTYIHT